jgi:hypothetical protein
MKEERRKKNVQLGKITINGRLPSFDIRVIVGVYMGA